MGETGLADREGDADVLALMEACFLPRLLPRAPLVLAVRPLLELCLLSAIAEVQRGGLWGAKRMQEGTSRRDEIYRADQPLSLKKMHERQQEVLLAGGNVQATLQKALQK